MGKESVRDIDEIVAEAKSPEKKFELETSKKERDYRVCLNCGELVEIDGVCNVCGLDRQTEKYGFKYQKWVRSE